MKNNQEEIIKLIQQLSLKHSTWQIFNDFLEIASISISNAIDLLQEEKRESIYLQIVKKYEKDELYKFSEMFALLVVELQKYSDAPQDVLGVIFHSLELHNKYSGQFFTHPNISDMMAAIAISKTDTKNEIKDNGYITVCEPACGSGAMLLSVAKTIDQLKYSHSKHLMAVATDIDVKCVYMTYIQLSLFGIPAVVIHGNSLTQEEYARWYTPIYILDGWSGRRWLGESVAKTKRIQQESNTQLMQIEIQKYGQTALF